MGLSNLFNIKISDHNAPYREPLSEEHLKQYIAVVEYLKYGFDMVNDHIIITDPNANIIYANKAVERNTGYSIDEIIGKNPGDLWGGQMTKEFYEKMWHAVKIEKIPFVGEVRNKRKDGTEYWQELHISPVLWHNGEVKFFIGIEPNITERKEKDKFREEFVSILAHQLKTPLTSVKWTIDWLFRRGKLTEEQQQTIETVYKSNESLINLVTDLLVFTKIGSIQLNSENMDLLQEVQSIIKSVKIKNPSVSFMFAPQSQFSLTTNKSLAFQVFLNLISNAAEYSDKTNGEVNIAIRSEDNNILFSVANNGTSIPQEEQTNIFSKFFRASNANQAKESGTGLGLFIVKMICDHFGWTVSFISPRSEGDGAIFFVRISRL